MGGVGFFPMGGVDLLSSRRAYFGREGWGGELPHAGLYPPDGITYLTLALSGWGLLNRVSWHLRVAG